MYYIFEIKVKKKNRCNNSSSSQRGKLFHVKTKISSLFEILWIIKKILKFYLSD